uniref:Uncharacterized protein n=1 Tax=Anguilla anguilla TaxID=7936 RepID=A0A0E9PUJ3_ANGAN
MLATVALTAPLFGKGSGAHSC